MNCDYWYHVKCVFNIKVSKAVYDQILAVDNVFWACNKCVKNVNLSQKLVQGQVAKSGSVNQFQTASQAIKTKVLVSAPVKHKTHPSPIPRSNARTKSKPATDGWEIVKAKNSLSRNKATPLMNTIKVTNRFKLLDIAPTNDKAEGTELKLIGDSIIKGQGADFSDRKKKKSSTFCRPGAKLDDITTMIKELNGNKTYDNKEIIIHVGTNDMVQPPKANSYRKRVIPHRASELIHDKFKNLIKALKDRNTQSYVVGMLPRFKVRNEVNSRILSMNSRVQQLCRASGVGYIDMFTQFQDNPNLFSSDGLHLSRHGKQLYAESLKFNINKSGN